MQGANSGPLLPGSIAAWARRDGPAIALYAAAVVLLTWPLAAHLSGGFPSSGRDIYAAHWQNWWLREALTHRLDVGHTPFLFYPSGLDASLQPRRWLGLITWLPFASLFGDTAAYNLNVLGSLLLGAYGAYLLGLYLTGSRIAGWATGAFFAFYPQHVADALGQPNTGSVHWWPFFLLLLISGMERVMSAPGARLDRRTVAWLAAAGAVGALNAAVNFKLWVFAAFIGGGWALLSGVLRGWWRHLRYWLALAVVGGVSIVLAAPVFVPYLSASWFSYAIEQAALRPGVDLMAYLKARIYTPLLAPALIARRVGPLGPQWGGGTFFVGGGALLAAALGTVRVARSRRQDAAWLLLAAVFFALSLGTTLSVDMQRLPEVPTLFQLFAGTALFDGLRIPHRFALVMSLPLAVIVGLGVGALPGWLRAAPRVLVHSAMVGLAAWLLVDAAQVPLPVKEVAVPAAYDALAPGAVIDLPMGREPSKVYMLYQMQHGRPIVEGMTARMPPEAYGYIEANPLLAAWSAGQAPACGPELSSAARQLEADGFSAVLLHHTLEGTPQPQADLHAAFAGVIPIYEDAQASAYPVGALADDPPCRP